MSVCCIRALGFSCWTTRSTSWEELLFSSAPNVASVILRIRRAQSSLAIKMLYYELLEAVEGKRHAEKLFAAFGPMPEDLTNIAF